MESDFYQQTDDLVHYGERESDGVGLSPSWSSAGGKEKERRWDEKSVVPWERSSWMISWSNRLFLDSYSVDCLFEAFDKQIIGKNYFTCIYIIIFIHLIKILMFVLSCISAECTQLKFLSFHYVKFFTSIIK